VVIKKYSNPYHENWKHIENSSHFLWSYPWNMNFPAENWFYIGWFRHILSFPNNGCNCCTLVVLIYKYKGADKSLARPTSLCILCDGENISFDAGLVIYINSTNIPPIMIINSIYETQNLLSL
jgi:hypothetical protein